jgi:hypothetical protein
MSAGDDRALDPRPLYDTALVPGPASPFPCTAGAPGPGRLGADKCHIVDLTARRLPRQPHRALHHLPTIGNRRFRALTNEWEATPPLPTNPGRITAIDPDSH